MSPEPKVAFGQYRDPPLLSLSLNSDSLHQRLGSGACVTVGTTIASPALLVRFAAGVVFGDRVFDVALTLLELSLQTRQASNSESCLPLSQV